MKRGALIVLEGVDRCGKSTQCTKLVAALKERNYSVELFKFPDRNTAIGQMISKYLQNPTYTLHDKCIHLLFTANRWENVKKMEDLLNSGTTLVIDRYSYSGIAFSGSKKGMDINWCKYVENGLPKPDRVFLLQLDTKKLVSRPGFGDERYENNEFQSHVSNAFQQMAADDTNIWKTINADSKIENIHHEILLDTIEVIKKTEDTSLKCIQFCR